MEFCCHVCASPETTEHPSAAIEAIESGTLCTVMLLDEKEEFSFTQRLGANASRQSILVPSTVAKSNPRSEFAVQQPS